MSEFDQLIEEATNAVQESSFNVEEACRRTIKDYQCLDTMDHGSGLRMIAWDRN